MDDPRREGYLHQSGAAGLPTGSIRDIIPYVVFLSLHSDFSILSVILPQEIRDTAAAMPQIPTVPMLSQFSVSALSNRSAFHTNCHVLYRVISCAPTTPALPPGNPAQSAYILRSDCVSRYCLILSAPTHISSQSTCDGSPLSEPELLWRNTAHRMDALQHTCHGSASMHGRNAAWYLYPGRTFHCSLFHCSMFIAGNLQLRFAPHPRI